jgi:S1-C subfamily serine protease
MLRYCWPVLIASIAATSISGSAHARRDATFFNKNGWTASVLNTKSGAIGCLARTALSERTSFALVRLRDGQWLAAFSRTGGFQRALRWNMELLVDGKSVHRGIASVGDSGMAIVEPALSNRAISALGLGQKLEVVTMRGRFEYALGGSGDAIDATKKCVSHFASKSHDVTGSIADRADPPRASSGTGFFITRDGRILTNAHVVRGCTTITAGLPGSPLQTVRVTATDTTNDLALLNSGLRTSQVPTFKVGVRTGEGIAVYGFPLAGILPSTGNFTLGNVTATAGMHDDARALQISAPVQHGSSGGPLLDQAGNVVGIVYGKINALAAAKATADIPQNVNFAVKAGIVLNFLQAHGVQANVDPVTDAMSPVDLADRAKTFTVFINCSK